MALLATAVVVVVLAAIFMVVRWDTANELAVVISALAAVASLGVAVWAALPAVSGRGIRAIRTGQATVGAGGEANTGYKGPSGVQPGEITVDRSGDASAPEGGSANTGIEQS
ncbi:MAG: hypothetical protein ACRDPF_22805 [Streptosporangiaceae bacterium]